jgi:hypothetical protein
MASACNSSSSKKKTENCSFNGVDVPCSSIRSDSSTVTTDNGDGTVDVAASTSMAVATVTSEISVNDAAGEFEVLSNDSDITTVTNDNGDSIECEAVLTAGDRFRFSQIGNKLYLSKGSESHTFTRVSDSNSRLNGEWSISADGDQMNFKFENNDKLTITLYCGI